MSTEEQQALFGAPMGDVVDASITMHIEPSTGRVTCALSVITTMRNKVMRICTVHEGLEDQTWVVDSMASLANICPYVQGETIRHHMQKQHAIFLREGVDSEIHNCGTPRLSPG